MMVLLVESGNYGVITNNKATATEADKCRFSNSWWKLRSNTNSVVFTLLGTTTFMLVCCYKQQTENG